MSDPKLISPMLDNFAMGDPISDHNGVRCCPAMEKGSDNKYIVKIISTPASQTQLDALLLSGAYSDKESALSYFKTLSDGIVEEAQIMQKLSQMEGFLPFDSWQIVPMEDEVGYDVYLLSIYRNTLERYLRHNAMTHLGALNLGLDLCAALAICRRSGYLYVDLKPENIYMTDDREYRIGDLGFLRLDALKYASLPDRYHSQYTAPEIADAFSALNTTIDIYAVGLILYQVFNDGMLPFKGDAAPSEDLPAPAYADYEMAEIILKACAADPAMRWQDPIEMGQALVSYMQRNGAHDTPIVPVPVEDDPVDEVLTEQEVSDTKYAESDDAAETDLPNEMNCPENCTDEDIAESIAEIEVTEESIYSEDSEGNLTFLTDDSEDETALENDPSEIDYEEVSEEVSDMLTLADELIEHPAPEPVVQPEPIDVPIPPPLPIENEPSDKPDTEEDTAEDTDSEQEDSDETDLANSTEELDEQESEYLPGKSGKHWLRNVILVVLALALLATGFYYYKNYYLQPIEAILLEEGDEGILTVLVSSQIDEDKLTVVCSDTYGNQLISPVEDGKAVFTGLVPDSAYTVKVVINGFHRLTGDTSAAYTTPAQTSIVQFRAVTGSEDGSAVLGFTIDGPDVNQWRVRYSTANEPEKEVAFNGHMVTLTGLTIGNEYTFTLIPDDDLHITGTNEIVFTASKIVKAEDLSITGCINNTLTAAWSAPEGVTVDSWTVRCYSDSGYDQTIVVTEATAAFTDVDPAQSYTIEVTAAGMSVSERAYAAANSITVTGFSADDSDPNQIVLTWNSNDAAPQDGWLLLYTMDGSAVQEIACQSGNSVAVRPVVPGVTYTFTLQSANGVSVLGGSLKYEVQAAEAFAGYGVSSEYMEFRMCKTPSFEGWDRYDLSGSDYTTEFSVGQNASFLVRLKHEYDTSSDTIVSLFVIRDESGNIVSTSTQSDSWTNMWYRNYCELDIPAIPQTPGSYSISVYFNGSLATMQSFSVVS